MTELKQAVVDKLKHYRAHLNHPDYNSEIEQNACQCLVRELEYLDSIVETKAALESDWHKFIP